MKTAFEAYRLGHQAASHDDPREAPLSVIGKLAIANWYLGYDTEKEFQAVQKTFSFIGMTDKRHIRVVE